MLEEVLLRCPSPPSDGFMKLFAKLNTRVTSPVRLIVRSNESEELTLKILPGPENHQRFISEILGETQGVFGRGRPPRSPSTCYSEW